MRLTRTEHRAAATPPGLLTPGTGLRAAGPLLPPFVLLRWLPAGAQAHCPRSASVWRLVYGLSSVVLLAACCARCCVCIYSAPRPTIASTYIVGYILSPHSLSMVCHRLPPPCCRALRCCPMLDTIHSLYTIPAPMLQQPYTAPGPSPSSPLPARPSRSCHSEPSSRVLGSRGSGQAH
jgi:hypothetical protein